MKEKELRRSLAVLPIGTVMKLTDLTARQIRYYEEQKKACQEEEDEFLKSALEGFLAARQTESFPMCGMDEPTVDYLIAVTAMRFEQYDVTSRLITGIITSPNANPRMKDKARDVKDMLMKKIKEKNAARK